MMNDFEFQIANTETDVRAYVELLNITKGSQPREFLETLLHQADQKLKLLKEQQARSNEPPLLSDHL
jgi:rubrerythrin